MICFDGPTYLSDIPAPTILDNLLAAGKIWPAVAVMVDNSEARLGDLANRAAFADFVGNELVPWIRASWRVTTEADKTSLCGYSAGGLAAAYVAWKRPELFGNVLSQSGALQAKGYDVRFLEVGGARHEPAHWRMQLATGLIYLFGKSSQQRTP